MYAKSTVPYKRPQKVRSHNRNSGSPRCQRIHAISCALDQRAQPREYSAEELTAQVRAVDALFHKGLIKALYSEIVELIQS